MKGALMSSFEDPLVWTEEPCMGFDSDDLNNFLQWATDIGASDVLIETNERLAIKLNKEVQEVGKREISMEEMSNLISSIYRESGLSEATTGSPCRFSHAFINKSDELLRFRVQATGCESKRGVGAGLSLVFRTIPGVPPTAEELGIEKEILDASNVSSGLIIIAGSTGSGKTTLLSAALGHIGTTKRKHIITYEDPPEFNLKRIEGIKGRIVQSDVPNRVKSFEEACADALRRAPDVILIGEASSKETIMGCNKLSVTGHLVFSTVHAINCATTLPRLVSEFEAAEQRSAMNKLVDALRMILFQRLVPKVGGGLTPIKEWIILDKEDRAEIKTKSLGDNDLGQVMDDIINRKGMGLIRYARSKLIDGIISFDTFYDLLTEFGTREDFIGAISIIEILLGKGDITSQEHALYYKLMEPYNHV
jgi:defect in organelle trafficking protein DotB